MDKEAVENYNSDCNCSQCMLRAADSCFGLQISQDAYEMCKVLCAGFGVGGFCCALVAGIMLFGLVADENTAKRMRIRLLTEFDEKYHEFNCAKLKDAMDDMCGCDELIRFTAGKIYEIIYAETGIKGRIR